MKFFALILIAAFLEFPGMAQRTSGSRASEYKAQTLDQITSYREMNDCQMRPNIVAAKALLASKSFAGASRHAARFKWLSCTLKNQSRGFMTVVPNNPKLDELRWMSAEYFLAGDSVAAALRPVPRQSAYVRDWFAASSRDDAIDAMAACVADINPHGIIELSKTEGGSPDERAAIKRLTPDFTSCLREGVTLNGGRKAIRGALVDALYQRTRVAQFAASNER